MGIAFKLNTKIKEHAVLKNRVSLLIILLTLLIFLPPPDIHAQSPCSGEVRFMLDNLTFPANLWRIEDVLNVMVENTTNDPLDVYLFATVYKHGTGKIFELTSNEFVLAPLFSGYLSPADTKPIEVEDVDRKFSEFARDVAIRTGSLPAGEYDICVYAYKGTAPDQTYCYGYDCAPQTVAHPSPPELIYPANESFVTEVLPVFSWLPPMPSSYENKYTIEIVEILDGQTPIEAIESNLRWYYESDINTTSFQYPIGEREFAHGARYAWRVEALMGLENSGGDINPKIISPVWSFTLMGPQTMGFNEQYFVSLVSPVNNDIVKDPPFFEWELTNPSSQKAVKGEIDEDISFKVIIWKWPDSLNASDAGTFMNNMATNPEFEPYYESNKLSTTYYNISVSDVDTIKNNYSYFWKVICIKDEAIIAESDFNKFSILSNKSFVEAAESMLNAVELYEESQVYGITEPVTPGAIIISEELSDLDTIEVNNALFLFIIDDEPYSRFGHPVRYALVDKETKAVTVYDANWFPEVKNVEDPWNSTGVAEVKGTEITMLTPRDPQNDNTRPREIADISDIKLQIDCGNYVLMIDGGDRNRTATTDNIASNAARDADSMQALYERKHYQVQRYSQYWDYKNEGIKTIPVDPNLKTGTKFLKDILSDIKEHYVSLECCTGTKLNFDFVIYINANAIPSSTKFKIYKQDGSGICEDIDYFEDILKYLQTLPQCVKITLVVDANFSGSLVDAGKLDSYLKRGNFEIITATDAKRTTPSGVNSHIAAAKPASRAVPAQPKSVAGNVRGSDASFTEMALALEKMKEMQSGQAPDKVNLGESYAKVSESIKTQAGDSKRAYPNPQLASIHARDEFYLQFAAVNNQAEIKECNVIPASSANIIVNKMNGLVTVFSKIKGEIKVVVTYENGLEEIKPITSEWGDNT
jgi:hypothetical protein